MQLKFGPIEVLRCRVTGFNFQLLRNVCIIEIVHSKQKLQTIKTSHQNN